MFRCFQAQALASALKLKPPPLMRRMNLNFRVAGSEPFFGGLPHTANTELNTNTADGFLLPTMLRVLTALAENTIDAGFAASFPPWPDGTQHEKVQSTTS